MNDRPAPRCSGCSTLRGILRLDRHGVLRCETCSAAARNDFDAGEAQRHASEDGRAMHVLGWIAVAVVMVIAGAVLLAGWVMNCDAVAGSAR